MIEEEKNNSGSKSKLLAEGSGVSPEEEKVIDYIPGTNIDKNLKLFKGETAIENAGFCSRFFFSWAMPFLRVSIPFALCTLDTPIHSKALTLLTGLNLLLTQRTMHSMQLGVHTP